MTTIFNLATASLEPGVTLIEASAGTGKTHAITTAYVRLLLELRLEVGEILLRITSRMSRTSTRMPLNIGARRYHRRMLLPPIEDDPRLSAGIAADRLAVCGC